MFIVQCSGNFLLLYSSFSIKQRALVLIGVAAFSWTLWLSRNDVVFQESKSKSYLRVMFRGTYWIRSLSILSREE
jgi:hypothetical protein